MDDNIEEVCVWDMPEETVAEIISKIEAYSWKIRRDWTDPRGLLSVIVRLCEKLRLLTKESEG